MSICRWQPLLLLTVAAAWCSGDGLAADGPKRPNILLILIDDLGKEWLSCYGAEDVETPNLDRLAAEGMRFENAYCMPQCTPTRVTLLTGQYPFRHGWVNHWDVPRWGGGCHFDANRNPSLARYLQKAGYKTAAAGKWQISDFRVQPEAMAQHGFDDWRMWTGFEGDNPPSAERYWNPYLHTLAGSQTYPNAYGPDLETDFLIDFMLRHRDEPLFLYYPMTLTHGPLVTTPAEPEATGDLGQHKAMVRYADHLVGRLITALKETDLLENTIVLVTCDNGTGGNIAGHRGGRLVQGAKGLTSEPGVCVPFIVNCPGRVPAGVVTTALTDVTDILPTLLELAGAPLPEGHVFDGRSIAPLITGQSQQSPRTWIMAMGGGNDARLTENGVENKFRFRDRVFRDERFKLYVDSNRQAVKLIDFESDPDESRNILAEPGDAGRLALEKFLAALVTMPAQDADPIYDPLPAQPWDVKVTARSQEWKQ